MATFMTKQYELNLNNKNQKVIQVIMGVILGGWLSQYFLASAMEHPVYLFMYLIIVFLLRFPHEYLHYAAGKLFGIDSKIKFMRINATNVPQSDMSFNQLTVIALAPLVVIGLIFGLATLLPVAPIMHKLMVVVLVSHLITCYGDILYVLTMMRFKESTFRCLGLVLEVYETK